MRRLQEVLHYRMVLLEECLHLLNQVLGFFLGPFVLVSKSINFIVKLLLDGFKLYMKALLITDYVGLEITVICLFVIDVVVE